MPVQAKPAPAAAPTTELDIENLLDTYHFTAEWIRFADAKAAAVITVAAALAGFLIPSLQEYVKEMRSAAGGVNAWHIAVVSVFAIWLLTFVAACVRAFACIIPFRRRGIHPALQTCPHFHPAAISTRYRIEQVEEFVAACGSLRMADFRKEVSAGLLIDAHISATKYTRVTQAIRLLAVNALLGFTYLVMRQF